MVWWFGGANKILSANLQEHYQIVLPGKIVQKYYKAFNRKSKKQDLLVLYFTPYSKIFLFSRRYSQKYFQLPGTDTQKLRKWSLDDPIFLTF